MGIDDWRNRFCAYMVERSDALLPESTAWADEEMERQREAFGDDPVNWNAPEDAAQACMEEWLEDDEPTDLPAIATPDGPKEEGTP